MAYVLFHFFFGIINFRSYSKVALIFACPVLDFMIFLAIIYAQYPGKLKHFVNKRDPLFFLSFQLFFIFKNETVKTMEEPALSTIFEILLLFSTSIKYCSSHGVTIRKCVIWYVLVYNFHFHEACLVENEKNCKQIISLFGFENEREKEEERKRNKKNHRRHAYWHFSKKCCKIEMWSFLENIRKKIVSHFKNVSTSFQKRIFPLLFIILEKEQVAEKTVWY